MSKATMTQTDGIARHWLVAALHLAFRLWQSCHAWGGDTKLFFFGAKRSAYCFCLVGVESFSRSFESMAKGSAISKAMAGKSRTSGTHVSGLSSGRSSAKRKADGVKFGSLSRKQKQDLKEYGSLVPQEFEDDDEELGSDEETSIK